MADDLNPYAPPPLVATADSELLDVLQALGLAWRDGPLVVVTHESVLPPFCVKTGEPAAGMEWLQVRWYPAWAVFSFVLGPLAFVALLFIPARKLELGIPISAAMLRTRMRRQWLARVGLVINFLAIGGLVAATILKSESLFSVSAATFPTSLVVSMLLHRPLLRVKRINARFAWLAGAGENFLAILPPWPGK